MKNLGVILSEGTAHGERLIEVVCAQMFTCPGRHELMQIDGEGGKCLELQDRVRIEQP